MVTGFAKHLMLSSMAVGLAVAATGGPAAAKDEPAKTLRQCRAEIGWNSMKPMQRNSAATAALLEACMKRNGK
jgi:hypothetical protein